MNRILLIEDDADAITVLRSSLNEIGHHTAQITVCGSIAEVRELQEDEFDLILCDLSLPDSGFDETFERVNAQFPFTPIIILSAHSEEELALKLVKQGAEDYLIKGRFDTAALKKSIFFALYRKGRANDFRSIFDASPVPMFIFDELTFRFLSVNKASLKQYGYSRREMLTMTALDIRPEEDRELFLNLDRSRFGREIVSGNWRHMRKDGEIFYVNIFSHRITYEERAAVLVFAFDINKKVKSEQMLEQRNQEIDNILRSMTDGFFILNRNWTFTYANSMAEKLLLKSQEELLGNNVWKLFPGAEAVESFKQYHRAMSEGVSVHFEDYYDPLKTWFSVNAYPYNEGLAVYFTDITERKKLQEKVVNSEHNLSAIINNTQDIIWSINKDLEIITANDKYWERIYEMTGKSRSELMEEDFDKDVFHTWRAYFKRAFAGETYKTIWNETFNGREIYEEISFNPIRDDRGEITGVSCFSRDITEQQMHLRLIEEQNEQLKKISWMQSHEIRRPLANIMGLVSLLDREELSPANNEKIGLIRRSAEELDTIIRQISRLSGSIS